MPGAIFIGGACPEHLGYYSEVPIPKVKRCGIGKLNYPARRRVEDQWHKIQINIVERDSYTSR